MDSNDLEKERGITILAKPTSVEWEGTRINIVDTPGHADFGGEVERILSMVDGVILLVDSSEGAMPQTKFVTGKALKLGLRPIVVVNKVDRPDERIQEVLDEVFDLFVSLDATDEQLDFPVLYASGRNGYANRSGLARRHADPAVPERSSSHVPPPALEVDAPFSFLVTLLDRDNFLGRILTGRVQLARSRSTSRSTRSTWTARLSKPAALPRSWPSAGLIACRSKKPARATSSRLRA
jgi:GTP-binding protein